MPSKNITEALDRISHEFPDGSDPSVNITQALDRIRKVVSGCCCGNLDYSQLAIGPVEQVVVFGSNDIITLKDLGVKGKAPYFSSHGQITDLCGRVIPETKVQSALPADPNALKLGLTWPPVQVAPFYEPPVDQTNTTDVHYPKTNVVFNKDDSIVSVGPILAKLVLVKGGGAQFWETASLAISQGTGKYEGAKGMQSFLGSAFFPKFPTDLNEQLALLAAGFPVRLVRCFKLVLKADQG